MNKFGQKKVDIEREMNLCKICRMGGEIGETETIWRRRL
jgi:hypothetical protein